MRRTIFVSSLGALASCTLISCDTPVGQGAGWGAATGAVIGGAATGQARYAAIGSLATLIRVAFSAGHNRDAGLRRFECLQRACACSLSTSVRASSVMLSNSGHGRW
jgi:hypothetical protein